MTRRRGRSSIARALAAVALAVAAWTAAAVSHAAPRQDSKERRREDAEEADRIGVALAQRVRGEARLDDVRVDVEWPRAGRPTTARVYGDGVGIWNRSAQFRLSRADVITILKTLQKARFAEMPEQFGEEEGEERERGQNEGPRLKGRVTARAGGISKSVLQLVDGEQSEELAALAEKLLSACERPARKGIGASSLADGLQKAAMRVLAPETVQATAQRRFDETGEDGETGWIVRLQGREVVDESLRSGRGAPVRRRLVLPERDFQALVEKIAASRPSEIPANVYASEYTDVRLEVLRWQRSLSGRRFLEMTAETHGAAQRSFDALYETFRDLHRRARAEGRADAEPD